MDELTESARQHLVSQSVILGGISILLSATLLFIGILVTTKNNDILHFIALYQLAILEIACGASSLIAVLYVWWIANGYRNRQLIVRSKYLDEKMSRGLIALILPLLLTFAAFIVSSIFLMIKTESTSSYDIKSAMMSYSTDFTRKVVVDKLQSVLKCCGSQEIEDWFSIDWQNLNSELVNSCNVTKCQRMYPSCDSVPFSCCCLESPPPCIHNRLNSFGTDSIYSSGCAEKLDTAVFVFVLLAVILFFISTLLMAVMTFLCRKLQTSARSAVSKGDATAPGHWWLITPPGYSCTKSSADSVPLLVRTSDDSVKCQFEHAESQEEIKKIITSPTLFVQKINPRRSCDEESSDEWSDMVCQGAYSASNSSFTRTDANNTILDQISDRGRARVNYVLRPLIRS